MEKCLSINVISKACGVLPHTLRVWEKRYQLFSPGRTKGGQRLYSEDDLVRVKLIVALMGQGHSISSLASYSKAELLLKLNPNENSEIESTKIITSIGTRKLLLHVANFNIEMFAEEMDYLRMTFGAKEFIFKIILPVIQEIGLMVSKGKCSITQEHIVSTIVRAQLSKLILPNSGKDTGRFALATPDGNLHEFSILIADIICRANRVTTSYLGASHPAVCLGEAVSALKCKTLVIGVVSSDLWDYETKIIPYLELLDKNLKYKVAVILGGAWQINFPQFKNITKVMVMNSFEEFDQLLSIGIVS
jgi:DNA-binding transcriptional MerR regulator